MTGVARYQKKKFPVLLGLRLRTVASCEGQSAVCIVFASAVRKMNNGKLNPATRVRKLSMYLFGNTFVRNKKTQNSDGFGEEEMQAMKQANSSMLDKLTQHWYIDNTARMCTDVPRLGK